MNAYLALTKLHGSQQSSALMNVASRQPGSKVSLYDHVFEQYKAVWKEEQQKSWYAHIFNRHVSIGKNQPSRILNCESPLITGMGRPSVLETHLTLHPIYGVPYLPGSALKGAAASFCHRHLGDAKEEFRQGGAYYKVLFGSKEQASRICYHDALVTPETVGTAFRQDVMTPHHQKYNQIKLNKASSDEKSTSSPPHDDDSPIPIPFLTVKASFQLILTDQGDAAHAADWLEVAYEIVIAALQQEGVGGKTNTGYGRFKLSEWEVKQS